MILDIDELVEIAIEAQDRYGGRARVYIPMGLERPVILDFSYDDDHGAVLEFVEKRSK